MTLTQKISQLTVLPVVLIARVIVTHRKQSYEEELHTVHLQGKINYLQLKLKEKSDQSQSCEDPSVVKLKVNEEKETKCNLPPTAPWPQKTKTSNNQNSYTGKPKDNNTEKDVPNP